MDRWLSPHCGPIVPQKVMKEGLERKIVDSHVGVHLLEHLTCSLRCCTCLRWTQINQCYLQVVLAVMYLL